MPAPSQFVNGKRIFGAAAQQHIIKKNGGWDMFKEKIATRAASKAVKEVLKELDEEFMKPALKRVK